MHERTRGRRTAALPPGKGSDSSPPSCSLLWNSINAGGGTRRDADLEKEEPSDAIDHAVIVRLRDSPKAVQGERDEPAFRQWPRKGAGRHSPSALPRSWK